MNKTKVIILLSFFALAAMAFSTLFDTSRFVLAQSDEVGYLTAGLQNMERQWNIYSFPLHSMTYALTGLLEPDPLRNYRLNAFVPFFFMIFLLSVFVYRRTGSAFLAITVTSPLLLASEMGLTAWPHSNQTVCIIFLIGLLLSPRNPTLIQLSCHLTLLFIAVGFARSEQILILYLMLILAVAWAGLWLSRNRDVRGGLSVFGWPIFSVMALLVATSQLLGPPILLDRYRSLSAFEQHFAYGLALRSDLTEHPWMESHDVFVRHFGDASSITEAMSKNMAAFSEHIMRNVSLFLEWGRTSDLIGFSAWCIALGVYIFLTIRVGREVFFRIRMNIFEPSDLERLILCLIPLPTLLLVLLIFPRANYLQMGYVLLVMTSFAMFRPAWVPGWLRHRSAAAFACIGAIAVLALIEPVPKRPDPLSVILQSLHNSIEDHGREAVRIASTANVCIFVEVPCSQVVFPYTEAALREVLDDGSFDYIIASKHPDLPELQDDLAPIITQFSGADDWTALLAPAGWNLLARSYRDAE